jgi:hypothetical protein
LNFFPAPNVMQLLLWLEVVRITQVWLQRLRSFWSHGT